MGTSSRIGGSPGRVLQRHALYLGEINSSQERAWRTFIEAFDEHTGDTGTLSLFPEDRCEGLVSNTSIMRRRLSELSRRRPRQLGACWLALKLWQERELDDFWAARLPKTRKGTHFDQVLFVFETYVFAQSHDRIAKERAMRKRPLKALWARRKQLGTMTLTHRERLMKLGAARSRYPAGRRRIDGVAHDSAPTFTWRLDRDTLRQVCRREGRYLLRTNLVGHDLVELWCYTMQFVPVEEAFKHLKGDRAIRPIDHQDARRIEAQVFIVFLSYIACIPR